MKTLLATFALAIALPVGAAMADDDDRQMPGANWQSSQALLTMAQDKGWTVSEFEIDDGFYEIEGRDGDGQRFEAKIDPVTLSIVEMESRKTRTGAAPATGAEAIPPAVVTR